MTYFYDKDLDEYLNKAEESDRERLAWARLKAVLKDHQERILKRDSDSLALSTEVLLFTALLPLEELLDPDIEVELPLDIIVDHQSIRDAGEILYKASGINGLTNPCIWVCIPRRVRRLVLSIWDRLILSIQE